VLFAVTAAVYLGALIGVGAWKARKIRTQEDFSLAGRSLSPVVLFGTLLATWIGTGSIFGNAEEAYRVGLAAFILPLGGVAGVVVLYFLAGRARRSDSFTIQDILEERFGPAARLIGTVTLLLAYLIIVSYQYRAGAAVLERLLPMEGAGTLAIIAVALFVILYTALAGMYSVAYTDVVNGLIMVLGIGAAIFFVAAKGGGVASLIGNLPPDLKTVAGPYGPFDYAAILLPPFLLLLGDANMYQRFFSSRDAGGARRAVLWLIAGILILEAAIIALAILGRSLMADIANPAHIIVETAFELVPAPLGALLVAAVLAVVISTADSYLLSPATSVVRDIYQRFIRPDAGPRTLVFVARLVVVALGLVALLLAFQSTRFFRVALFAYTIYGVGITPALVAALVWKGAKPAGALSGMVIGVLSAVVWKFTGLEETTGIGAVIPSILLSCTAIIVVSLLVGRRESRT